MLMASAPKKKQSSRADRAREIALYRYALIRPLADPALSASERGKLVRQLASQVHLGPFGEPVTVSRATLDRWIRAWRSAGFDALIPAEAQVEPRTDPGVLELAARLKAERRARTAAHIARIIAQQRGWTPSARTLQRHFARLELGTRPDGNPPKVFGRFEAAACDELWVSDGLHGPIIDDRRAVLFALLDDHCAPRGASLYPRRSRDELGGRFVGLMAYLDPKGEGDKSMPRKAAVVFRRMKRRVAGPVRYG